MALRTVIVGTGSAIPRRRVSNAEMLGREFWGPDGKKIPTGSAVSRASRITAPAPSA